MLETVATSERPTVQQLSFSGHDTACPIGELVGFGIGRSAVKQCQPLSFFFFFASVSVSGQWGASEGVRNLWGNVGLAFHVANSNAQWACRGQRES